MDNNAKKPGAGIMPAEGSMDTSSGAAQQSSAPPSSAAATGSSPGRAVGTSMPETSPAQALRQSSQGNGHGDKQGMNTDTRMGGQLSGNRLRPVPARFRF